MELIGLTGSELFILPLLLFSALLILFPMLYYVTSTIKGML